MTVCRSPKFFKIAPFASQESTNVLNRRIRSSLLHLLLSTLCLNTFLYGFLGIETFSMLLFGTLSVAAFVVVVVAAAAAPAA